MTTRRRLAPTLALAAALAAPLAPGCSLLAGRSNAGIGLLEEGPEPVATLARGAKYLGWGLSAPAVAALAPLAALLWATPWVDLPLAVDLATAPAIGLGYATEGAVGFPLYGLFFWAERPAPEPAPLARVAAPVEPPRRPFVPPGFPVAHHERPAEPRPAASLPPGEAAYYAAPAEDVAALRAGLAGAWPEGAAAPAEVPLRRDLPGERFRAALLVYPAEGARGPAPLLLMTPPTQAAFAARYLARRFARRGVHVAVVEPSAVFLEEELTPAEVEGKLREAVVSARTALAALAARADVDRTRLRYLGVSAGAIFGAVLFALEPALDRGVLVLPGGDLPRIVAASDESHVTAYREAWAARGVPPGDLRRAFAGAVRTDPLRLAPHVDPARLLLFVGADDTKVPTATGLELHQELGRPELWLMAGNHETASLCFGFVLREAEAFLFGW